MITEHIAPGVIRTDAGLYYFSGAKISKALQTHGIHPDAAARIVGELVGEMVLHDGTPTPSDSVGRAVDDAGEVR